MNHHDMQNPLLSAKTRKRLIILLAVPALVWAGLMLDAVDWLEPSVTDCCAGAEAGLSEAP